MPAVLVDVGYNLVEPNASGQVVSVSVVSSGASDSQIAGFDLRAQIVTAKAGPTFESVRFAGDLWNTFPHVESGGPLPSNPTIAAGNVAFTQGLESRADGTLVNFTIDTTGIPAGSYEFRLVGTQIGDSTFRRADDSRVVEVIANGTLQVRSIWQNSDNPNDVNDDGRISPLDVLLLLNELSKSGSYELPMPSNGEGPPPYLDSNGDGYLSPSDPLGVINCLNGLGCVTSPPPILAQVTPDFAPDPDESTSVKDPDDPETTDPPAEETEPDAPVDCDYYYVDEDGNLVVDPDSEYCDETGYAASVPEPEGEAVLSASDSLTENSQSEDQSAVDNMNFASTLSASAIDAVIEQVIAESSSKDASEDLVDLGLNSIFAVS
jgi:Dockerin type I domain